MIDAETTSVRSDTGVYKKRIAYPDVLRIIASFAVILIHVSSQHLADVEPGSYTWRVFMAVRDLSGFAVPVFVMISGSIFLDRDIPAGTMITKYVFRIAVAFCFWSLIYSVLFMRSEGILTMAGYFIKGYSHMWFLYMIAGLYLITPFLRRIVVSEDLLKLFVILGLLFYAILPGAVDILGGINYKVGEYLRSPLDDMNLTFCVGFVFYYVLGYYLRKNPLSGTTLKAAVALGIICFVLSGALYASDRMFAGIPVGEYFNSLEIVKIIKTVFVYESVHALAGGKETPKPVTILAECSFGVYLSHQMFINLLKRIFGLDTLSFGPVVSILTVSLITLICAYGFTWIMRKIPPVRRYLM